MAPWLARRRRDAARLDRELGALLSQEAMDELMETLPPVGWGEIARRQDLVNVEHVVRGEIAELRGEMHTEFAAVRTEMTTALRLHLFATLGAMFTLAGLTWAATSIT